MVRNALYNLFCTALGLFVLVGSLYFVMVFIAACVQVGGEWGGHFSFGVVGTCVLAGCHRFGRKLASIFE